MMVFLDTEFSTLAVRDSQLISIGLVAEDGREFYGELPPDTYQASCTPFVQDSVLPLLQGGHFEMEPLALATALRDWFQDFDGVEIVTDSPDRDFPFLVRLILLDRISGWPSNVEKSPKLFNPEGKTLHDDADVAAREAFEAYWKRGVHRHHALYDARALRVAWAARKMQPGSN